METTESKIGRIADRVSQHKLQEFTRLLRKNLVQQGIDESIFDNAAQATTLELEIEESHISILDQIMRSYENRGMDTVGRIIVEFCFVRSPLGRMIWPEYSDEDTMARWQFSESVIPRPLMRYFLISIRGTIESIDGFESNSFLFENNPEEINTIRQTIANYIEDFKGPFGSGESAVDWQEVYDDQRFQKLALGIIQNMRSLIEENGLECYLRKLEEYRNLDPLNEESNLMQRSFTMEDASQISLALSSAESSLMKQIH